MESYTVTAAAGATVPAGSILLLTDAQLARRAASVRVFKSPAALRDSLPAEFDMAALAHAGERRVPAETLRPVMFKYGETFTAIHLGDGAVNKALFTIVAAADSPPAKDARRQAATRRNEGRAKTKEAEDRAAEEQANRARVKAAGKGKGKSTRGAGKSAGRHADKDTAAAAKAGKGTMDPAGEVKRQPDTGELGV